MLDAIDDYKIDGKYHLRIVYPELGGSNEWTQTSNPVKDSTIKGYQPLSVDYTFNGQRGPWGGLGKCSGKPNNAAICDTPTTGYWWMCVGCKGWYQKTGIIPGPSPHAVKKVELYIRNPSYVKPEGMLTRLTRLFVV